MINIDVIAKTKKWQEEKNIEKFIEKTCFNLIPLTDLKKILKKDFTLELAVSLVSNQQIKKINYQFRQKNKPTNVLSFPQLDEKLLRKIGIKNLLKNSHNLFLGDVVIAYEILKKEALIQKKSFKNHLTHLILHSILHLIGYDHEDDKMAKEMERLEIKILHKLNIKNPY